MTDRRFAVVLVGVASVALGAAVTPSSSVPAAAPDLGRTFLVSAVSGKVFVKPAGAAGFSRLTTRRTIPVGSTVNATDGKVRLVGAKGGGGGTQSGVFYGGAFKATQAEDDGAVIDLQLAGGRFAGCASGSGATASAGRRLGRKLWGNARGNFRTRGKHSSATVRGTKWLTRDRCASTGIEARRGKVETSNVASDTPVELEAGDSSETLCVPKPNFPERDYCLQVEYTNRTAAFIVITRLHQGDYELCVQSPRGALRDVSNQRLPRGRGEHRGRNRGLLPAAREGDLQGELELPGPGARRAPVRGQAAIRLPPLGLPDLRGDRSPAAERRPRLTFQLVRRRPGPAPRA